MPNQQQPSFSQRFLRGAGETNNANLWGPTQWVVNMVQYMITLVLIMAGEGIKAVFTRQKPRRGHEA
ncbi:hypothetical protein BU23DRAFT_558007 [Bimuria novae-zelandiae CBS 107.79]|uniref:Uncharacterized protein n=1 Tax=Bimuria novae-zelandiae CBS 107.79 TaxID=1447943 RepID=A0A6A5V6M6_9PLEO|nr:hypothetical protein BU23DRAFT_558007 [Bimuria novae-zelandiae CBS 107.79]